MIKIDQKTVINLIDKLKNLYFPPGIGRERRKILDLALPSVVELILVNVCDMADTMMVSRLGTDATSAVAITQQAKLLMLTAFFAFNVGSTALVARYKGQDDKKGAAAVARQSLSLCFFLSIAFAFLGYVFTGPLVGLMGGKGDIYTWGVEYFQIIMIGLPFNVISITITAVLRGVGNTRTSMLYNVAANVINVIFNYLLIYGKFGFPALGVRGAAIATVIGWGVATLLALIAIFGHKNFMSISFKESYKPDFNLIKRISKIGLPSAFEQIAMRAGLIIFNRIIINLGSMQYATHVVCMNILSLSFVNGQAFGVAASSLVGQSLGRQEPEKAQLYGKETRRIGSFVSTVMAICFVIFGKQLVWLYYPDNIEVINLGSTLLIIVAVLQPFQSSFQVLAGALRGAGETKWPAISITAGILIIRPALAIIFVYVFNFGIYGAWVGLFTDQMIRYLITTVIFAKGKWKTIKV